MGNEVLAMSTRHWPKLRSRVLAHGHHAEGESRELALRRGWERGWLSKPPRHAPNPWCRFNLNPAQTLVVIGKSGASCDEIAKRSRPTTMTSSMNGKSDHGVALAIHRGFLDAFAVLSKQDQARVRATLDDLLSNAASKGLRVHKVGAFVSISASLDLRIISWLERGRHGNDSAGLNPDSGISIERVAINIPPAARRILRMLGSRD